MYFSHQQWLLAVALLTGSPFSICAAPADLDIDDLCSAGQSCGLDLLQRRSSKVMSQEAVRQVEKQAINATMEEHLVGDEDVSSGLNHDLTVTDRTEWSSRVKAPKWVKPFLGHGPVINSTPKNLKMTSYGHPPFARTLANWSMANASTGIRLYMPPRKHRLAVSDDHGDYLFVADFTKFSFNFRVHMSEARTGKMLAEITRRNDALHEIWEIGQWFPICPSQEKYETTTRGDVYPYARLTKLLRMADENASYDVELYNCDGSLSDYWHIQDKMLPGTEDVMMHVLAVHESANHLRVGVLTQEKIEERQDGVNCYIAGGEDTALAAAVSIILNERMAAYQANDAQLTLRVVIAFCIAGPIFAWLATRIASKYL
eukprot:TRINITY_DN20396_c0_g1_i1.p1 TRINITY_DN20396_c0_g1~~TRINITY_DN20396_c0_g1_i1.p1  ORF type:complete len:373 (-),score=39.86 TRINITY_DN20396_c0_g1_i1:335-1453(-)